MANSRQLNLQYIDKNNLENMISIYFDDGSIYKELKTEGVVYDNNKVYINIDNLKSEYSFQTGIDIPSSVISKIITELMKKDENALIFFEGNTTNTHNNQKRNGYIIFKAIFETFYPIKDELEQRMYINSSIKQYEESIFKAMDEFDIYSTLYNKANDMFEQVLNDETLYTLKGQEIKNVMFEEGERSFPFIKWFNSIGSEELYDKRLNKYADKNFLMQSLSRIAFDSQDDEDLKSLKQAEEYYKDIKDHHHYISMLYKSAYGFDKTPRISAKSSNDPYFYFTINDIVNGEKKEISVSITYNSISIKDKDFFDKSKEILDKIYSTDINIEYDKKQESSLYIF